MKIHPMLSAIAILIIVGLACGSAPTPTPQVPDIPPTETPEISAIATDTPVIEIIETDPTATPTFESTRSEQGDCHSTGGSQITLNHTENANSGCKVVTDETSFTIVFTDANSIKSYVNISPTGLGTSTVSADISVEISDGVVWLANNGFNHYTVTITSP